MLLVDKRPVVLNFRLHGVRPEVPAVLPQDTCTPKSARECPSPWLNTPIGTSEFVYLLEPSQIRKE